MAKAAKLAATIEMSLAISQMKAFCSFFVNAIDYEVPDQDLDLDLETGELPPMPKSRFIMRNVRPRQ